MKISIDWLRDFVPVASTASALAESLTLAGLEVDDVIPAGGEFDGVIVAEILERRPHPDADRLSICHVSDGKARHEIVCGAPNAAAGIRVPFAPVGTVLPGGLKIRPAKIRGVRSEGMLCSARELGLGDDSAGLLVLDGDAAIGSSVREHLKLDDFVLDVDLTPNRGDCFSVLGIAREVAAREGIGPLDEDQPCLEPGTDRTFDVELIDTAACPRFAGRVIEGLAAGSRSPDWLRERLRRAGLRPIHPVVDVTNYVMLELGQPLHAYRLDRLAGHIEVRLANTREPLTLLDGTRLELDTDVLVIADESGAIGLAGIMGGQSTAVDASTDTIFLESAFFAAKAIQGRARRYGLHTDASVRFERGVDPTGQERAVERATELLLAIAGGRAGPVVLAEDESTVPARPSVRLEAARIEAALGIAIGREEAEALLTQLGMQIEADATGWTVTPPSYRFDIAIEADLIEELGRMIGYDRIPVTPGTAAVALGRAPETRVDDDRLADLLVARGYAEVISYGFTEEAAQARLTGSAAAIRLANPISQELGVMRQTLWPGLLSAARLNRNHQIERCRIFELGTVFGGEPDAVVETKRIAGLVMGSRLPAHWDGTSPAADFFDVKADVDALLAGFREPAAFTYRQESAAALNPARAAAICRGAERIGWLGELHPKLMREYEFRDCPILFEIDLTIAGPARLPKFAEYSRYPSVRRDLAVVVDEKVSVGELTELVAGVLGGTLRRHEIFDLYRGKGVDTGRKSVGIGLILQDAYRTLTDKDIDDMIEQVVRRLEHELGATIRK